MQKHHRILNILISVLLLSGAQNLLAGTLVTYEAGEGGSISYEIDGDNMRVNMSQTDQAEQMYHLIIGDHAYQVITGDDGKVMVMDIAQTMGMVGSLTKMANVKVEQLDFVDTGKKETIAGYQGRVYLSTIRFESMFSKETTTSEIVLSDHPDVYAATQATGRFSKSITRSAGSGADDIQKTLNQKKLGLLRSDDLRLVSIQTKNIAAERFKLPAEPISMKDMMAGAGASTSQERTGSDQGTAKSTGLLGSIFKRKSDRQKNRTNSKANRATDKATDKVVDKAVDKVLGKIFGF